MPTQAWQQILARQTTAGTLFNTFTTAKTVINQEALVPFAPNYLRLGDAFRVTIEGGISNIVTTPGTMAFQIMMATNIIAWTSGNIQLNATAHTTLPFRLIVDLNVQVLNVKLGGAVAQFYGQGVLTGRPFTLVAGATDATEPVVGNFLCPATAPALGTAFDATISQTMDFFAAFSISNAGNGIQVWNYLVEQLT